MPLFRAKIPVLLLLDNWNSGEVKFPHGNCSLLGNLGTVAKVTTRTHPVPVGYSFIDTGPKD